MQLSLYHLLRRQVGQQLRNPRRIEDAGLLDLLRRRQVVAKHRIEHQIAVGSPIWILGPVDDRSGDQVLERLLEDVLFIASIAEPVIDRQAGGRGDDLVVDEGIPRLDGVGGRHAVALRTQEVAREQRLALDHHGLFE